jgi:FxsC-like protein
VAQELAMAYEFFFSYTRANNDEYLKTFFEDLSEEVRLKRGLPAGTAVGFFDQRSIELGEEWDAAIVDALQNSRVMVAAASLGYFNSEYCGKEWTLFRRRCQAAAAGGKTPPLIKAVAWVEHSLSELPPEVLACQLTLGDPHGLHNTKGVRHLLRREGKKDAYIDLVDSLASQIVDAGNRYPLPPLAAVPSLASLPSAFRVPAVGAAPGAAAAPVPVSTPAGPRQVNFVYVAAHPDEIKGARAVASYADVGAGDWRPFFPTDARRVHPLMQNIASDPALDFSSIELPFGADLLQRVDEAWKQRQIVVIVVDAWSLYWDAQRPQPMYQQLLASLDGRFDYHWCVLVPWNEQDADTMAQAAQIRDLVRTTFDRHARLMPNPMFYRDGIRSVDEFKAAVAEVLTRLKEEIRKTAPVLRSVPPGPSRVLVSGPTV